MNKVLAGLAALLLVTSAVLIVGARGMAEGGPPAAGLQARIEPLPGLPPGARRTVALSDGIPGMLQGGTLVSAFQTNARAAREAERNRDQIRDWLLLTIVLNNGFEAADIAATSYEAPKLRSAYAHVIGQFQYGPMRWATLRDGSMVVLLSQEQTEAQRADDTAAAADAYVVQHGVRPTSVHLVVYCLTGVGDGKGIALDIQRAASLAEAEIFGPAFGWVEANLSTDGLDGFLDRVDDLIGLQSGASGIVATGRKYRSRNYGHVTAEHLATLWQAQTEIRDYAAVRNSEYNDLIQTLVKEHFDAISATDPAFKSLWKRYRAVLVSGGEVTFEEQELVRELRKIENQVTESIDGEVKELQRQRNDCTAVVAIAKLSIKSDQSSEEKAVLDLWSRIMAFESAGSPHEQSLRRGGIGFSLDPRYRKADVEGYLRSILGGDTLEFTERLQRQLERDAASGNVEAVPEIAGRLSEFVVDYIRPFEKPVLASISSDDELELLSCLLTDALSDMDQNKHVGRSVRDAMLEHLSYQTARYDGGIEGTEAGMILFYTDLMAKLYGQDFLNLAGNTYGPGVPQWIPTAYDIDPAYVEEAKELPATRIWFGLRSDAVRPGVDGSVSFIRTAARVFALSNAGTGDKKEAQASYLNEVWVDYFNEHYNLIAATEARYDQLNQLTKWSLALDSLRNLIDGTELGGTLDRQQVRRDLWFPTWLASANGGTPLPAWANCFREPTRPEGWAVETTQIYHVSWPDAPSFWCEGTPSTSSWSRVWGFKAWALKGGVSLPAVESIGDRLPARMLDVGSGLPPTWRPQALADGFSEKANGLAAKFVPENGYTRTFAFETADAGRQSTVTARAVGEAVDGITPDVLVRGQSAQVKSSTLVEEIATHGKNADIHVTDGRLALGHIEISAGSDAFRIGATPGSRHVADSLALTLSRSGADTWSRSLISDLRVDGVIVTGDRHLARLTNGEWFEFSLESKTNPWNGEIWQSRASDDFFGFAANAPKVVMSRSVDPMQLQDVVRGHEWVEFVRVPRDDGTFAVMIRGPPNGPPPPTGSVGLTFGPPDNPRRGTFDGDGSAFFSTDKPIPFDPLITTLKAFDERRLLESKVGDTIVLAAVEPVPKPSPDVLALPAKLQTVVDNRDGYSLRTALDSVKTVRKEINAALEKSIMSGDLSTAAQLQRSLASTVRATQAEARASVQLKFAEKGLTLDEGLLAEALTPIKYGEEMQARAVAAAERGPDALAETVQQTHLAFAEASQILNNTGLSAVKGTSAPRVALEVNAAYRQLPAAEKRIREAKLIYASEDLAQANLADPLVLASVVRDSYLIEIVDPQGMIARGIRDGLPEELVLGGNLRVTLTRSDIPKPSFAGNENWQQGYKDFVKHISTPYACAGAMVVSDSGCSIGSGGGGGGEEGKDKTGGSGSGSGQVSAVEAPDVLILISKDVACRECETCQLPAVGGQADQNM